MFIIGWFEALLYKAYGTAIAFSTNHKLRGKEFMEGLIPVVKYSRTEMIHFSISIAQHFIYQNESPGLTQI